jgi:small basic protein
MNRPSLPPNVSRWEIAGVSVAPIVTALLELEIPQRLGLTIEQAMYVLAALATIAAMVRAGLDARKGAARAQ